MKSKFIVLSATILMATASAVHAQGVSSKTPGHEMQQMGSKTGEPGASSYAPGHTRHHAMHHAKASTKTSAGASNYAPGQTTGSSTRSQTTGTSTMPKSGKSTTPKY
ncbi:hypothetical protein ACTGJ9_026605 [Bradyrhizobium sp. RDM12]